MHGRVMKGLKIYSIRVPECLLTDLQFKSQLKGIIVTTTHTHPPPPPPSLDCHSPRCLLSKQCGKSPARFDLIKKAEASYLAEINIKAQEQRDAALALDTAQKFKLVLTAAIKREGGGGTRPTL